MIRTLVLLQMYYKYTKENLWKQGAFDPIHKAHCYTTGATDIAVPKMLVLLFGDDMPHANQ